MLETCDAYLKYLLCGLHEYDHFGYPEARWGSRPFTVEFRWGPRYASANVYEVRNNYTSALRQVAHELLTGGFEDLNMLDNRISD